MSTEETLRKILEKRTNIKDVDLNKPISELGLDSLDLVEVMLEIEEELGITFSSDEIGEVKTLGEVKNLIDSKLKCK
mgnify:CR=1 FL=1